MKILLTGATGFVGSHLARGLLDAGHELTVLKRQSSDTWRISDILNRLKVVDVDPASDYNQILASSPTNMIIHAATQYIKHHTKPDEVRAMNDSNIMFPSLLLEAAVRNNVQYFINTGTCFEYALSDMPLNEESEARAYNYYASTKLAFERILEYFAHNYPVRAITLKLFYPYGEADNLKIIPLMARAMATKNPLAVTRGEQRLDFTYVGDIVQAYIKAISYVTNSYMGYETFNIGTGKPTAIHELVTVMEEISGAPGMVSCTNPYPEKDIMFMQSDPGKAHKELKWSATTDMKSGLKRTYDYYVSHEK